MTEMTLWIMVGMFIPIMIITAITPLITRKIEAFGVTVPEGVKQDSFVKKHIKSYVVLCTVIGAIIIVLLSFLMNGNMTEQAKALSFTGAIFFYIFVTFLLYYYSHRSIKAWKQTQSWYNEQVHSQKIVIQTGFHAHRTTISLLWYLPHFIVVSITAVYSLLQYDKFPDIIPMQFDFNGEVTRAVDKSIASVLSLSFLALAIVIVFVIAHISISKAKQLVESEDPEGSLEKNRKFRNLWSIFTAGAGFLVVVLMCLIQLSILLEWSLETFSIVPLGIVVIIIVGAIGLSMYTGQGGSRIKLNNSRTTEIKAVADQDQYWKAGVFYWNYKDPAIFVEKRFGVGWTMNFARPISWIIILGIFAVILIPTLLLS